MAALCVALIMLVCVATEARPSQAVAVAVAAAGDSAACAALRGAVHARVAAPRLDKQWLDVWLRCAKGASRDAEHWKPWSVVAAGATIVGSDGRVATGKLPAMLLDWHVTDEHARWVAPSGDLAVQWVRFANKNESSMSRDAAIVWLRNDTTDRPEIALLLLHRPDLINANAANAFSFAPPVGLGSAVLSRSDHFDDVGVAEMQLAGLCGANGMLAAFNLLGDDSVQVSHAGAPALRDLSQVLRTPRFADERWRYAVYLSGLAVDGTHAFSFGRYIKAQVNNSTDSRAGFFLRVWVSPKPRKNAPLRLALDFAN